MKDSWYVYKRLLSHTIPYRVGFVIALIGMIIAAATEPLFPAMMKPMLDEGFVNSGGIPLWMVPTALIGIFVVRGIATFGSNYAMAWVANKVLIDLRREMFTHMLRLPAEAFEREASGLLISKIVFEVTNVTGAATRTLTVLVRDSLVVLGLLGWLLYLNWKLTLVALLLIPATAFVINVYSRRMRELSRRNLEYTGELTRVVEEAVHGYKVVKIFGGYEQEGRLFERTAEKLRGFAMRMTIAGSATVPITQLCAAVAVSVVVTIAMVQSINGQTSVGGFVSFITAMLMLLAPLKHLADINAELQRGLAAAEAVFRLLDQTAEQDTGTRTLGRARGDVRFEHVSFRYREAELDALHDINLTINAGEVVALVGPSGAGKSSLINLLPRLVHPGSGRILLDGVPWKTLPSKTCASSSGWSARMSCCSMTRCAAMWPSVPAAQSMTTRSGRRCGAPLSKTTCAACPAVSITRSASGVPSSRVASASAWPLPAHCSRIRRFCCSTRRRRHSTRVPSAMCSRPSSGSWPTGPRWSLLTACQPSSGPTVLP